MSWILEDKSKEWIATEKIDGTSTTFTLKKGKVFHKDEFYVCSRNVCFDTPEKKNKCYYESNVYIEMAEHYKVRNILESILYNNDKLDYVTIQGETYGDGIQKRTYHVPAGEHHFMAFNLIYGYKDGTKKRFNPVQMTEILFKIYELPCVPIVKEHFILPDTIEELRVFVNSNPSALDNDIKEGIVCRSYDGVESFKCVDPEFLIKFHQ